MLLLVRPRGPQAMHRALMPSQWLLLMLSHCQPIFQPHLYLIRDMLHPRTSLSQLWIRTTDGSAATHTAVDLHDVRLCSRCGEDCSALHPEGGERGAPLSCSAMHDV